LEKRTKQTEETNEKNPACGLRETRHFLFHGYTEAADTRRVSLRKKMIVQWRRRRIGGTISPQASLKRDIEGNRNIVRATSANFVKRRKGIPQFPASPKAGGREKNSR